MKKSKWVVPKHRPIKDPRIAIAQHIGWTRPLREETDFHIPEPDNFNYAVLDYQPRECPDVINHVFYKDPESNLWWTVYLVLPHEESNFFAWADPIDFIRCWSHTRNSKLRKRKPLLWVKRGSTEQSLPERLYTMGYYDKLIEKCPNSDMVTSVLGPPREIIPYHNDGSNWADINNDTADVNS